MRSLGRVAVVAAILLSMAQRCPTEPSQQPCSFDPPVTTPVPADPFTQADIDDAYERGKKSVACQSITDDNEDVKVQAVDDFVSEIFRRCHFGVSVTRSILGIDAEVKSRIERLQKRGVC